VPCVRDTTISVPIQVPIVAFKVFVTVPLFTVTSTSMLIVPKVVTPVAKMVVAASMVRYIMTPFEKE
jgi:hypothetical protein